MKTSGNKILITGGATGIGFGLAERFIADGNTVIICGRRQTALDEAQARQPGLVTRVCDLASESERTGLFEWIQTEHPNLTVLINNAGVQNWMNVTGPDFYENARQEIEINITAPVHLNQLFLKLNGLTTIMNVSSGLAFTPFSKVPVYCATKAFLRSYTISLRHQLKDTNVEVIEIIPPALNTDLGGKGIHANLPTVAEFIESIFAQLADGKNELTFGSSATRAEANNAAIGEYLKQLNP